MSASKSQISQEKNLKRIKKIKKTKTTRKLCVLQKSSAPCQNTLDLPKHGRTKVVQKLRFCLGFLT
ncbi:MAG: hypothetical protein ACTTJS_07450 [Wolinella sp.]